MVNLRILRVLTKVQFRYLIMKDVLPIQLMQLYTPETVKSIVLSLEFFGMYPKLTVPTFYHSTSCTVGLVDCTCTS
jgi:hypothetical protein